MKIGFSHTDGYLKFYIVSDCKIKYLNVLAGLPDPVVSPSACDGVNQSNSGAKTTIKRTRQRGHDIPHEAMFFEIPGSKYKTIIMTQVADVQSVETSQTDWSLS